MPLFRVSVFFSLSRDRERDERLAMPASADAAGSWIRGEGFSWATYVVLLVFSLQNQHPRRGNNNSDHIANINTRIVNTDNKDNVPVQDREDALLRV